MRMIGAVGLLLLVAACDRRASEAESIVKAELGNPKFAEFRRVRAQGEERIVCGEVDASDWPGTGWRYFVAYLDLKRAVVSPPGGVTSEAEFGAVPAGAANAFNHACD